MTEELTYYCGEHVFLSFLEAKQLWLTSLTQSNDAAEGRWMRNHWLDQFFGYVSAKKRLLGRGASLCMDMASRDRMALGVCFSEERDLLSQWRGYASDGAGFSITFSKDALETVAKNHSASRVELAKIAYGGQDNAELDAIMRLLDDAFVNDAHRYSELEGIGSLILSSGMNDDRDEKYERAARSLFTVKNGAFREEKEWRLFTYGTLASFGGVKLRGTGRAISPYIAIDIPADSVTQVTLGPRNQTPEHVVKFALRSNGFSEVSVRTSTASYQAR